MKEGFSLEVMYIDATGVSILCMYLKWCKKTTFNQANFMWFLEILLRCVTMIESKFRKIFNPENANWFFKFNYPRLFDPVLNLDFIIFDTKFFL